MAITKDIEVKVWYSVGEDDPPVAVGTATLPVTVEGEEMVIDAQPLRLLTEEIIIHLEAK